MDKIEIVHTALKISALSDFKTKSVYSKNGKAGQSHQIL